MYVLYSIWTISKFCWFFFFLFWFFRITFFSLVCSLLISYFYLHWFLLFLCLFLFIILFCFWLRYLEAPKCVRCSLMIYDATLVSYSERFWHKSCFRCMLCQKELNDACFTNGKEFYCPDDFNKWVNSHIEFFWYHINSVYDYYLFNVFLDLFEKKISVVSIYLHFHIILHLLSACNYKIIYEM
jgi:hypothetical protein